jgi:hypothetical protein
LETYNHKEQLENCSVFFQTEYLHPEEEDWIDVTRRETMDGAEAAIDGSIEHYSKKLEFLKGPKVVKTFE